MTAAAAIESGRIKRRHLVITALIDHAEINLETAEKHTEHLIGVNVAAQYLRQRYRIWRIAHKLTLIEIDACAENTAAYVASADSTFRERSADFLVAPVNVVRPFYRDVVDISGKSVTYGQRLGLEHDILAHNRQRHGINLYAERKVLAALTLPLVFALTAPCRLKGGNAHGHKPAFFAGVFAHKNICRAGFVNLYYLYIFHFSIRQG